MKKDSDALRQLKAELLQDYDFIKLNAQKNTVMSKRVGYSVDKDEFLYAALGYTLHNFYNAVELANQAAQHIAEDFKPYHDRFIAFLDKLIAEVDEYD